MDCNWEYLQTLRTLKSPQPMPRLKDLLEYLASPGLEDIWVLLDIKLLLPSLTDAMLGTKVVKKLDDYADDLFRAIAATLADVPPSSRPWNQRILLGCWAVGLYFYFLNPWLFLNLIFLTGKIPSALHKTSSRVPSHPHRIQRGLCAPVPQGASRWPELVSDTDGRTAWESAASRNEDTKIRPHAALVDSE